MYSSVSVGKKELCHKTCGTPRSSHSSRTREGGATATTAEASPFSMSLAKSLQLHCGFRAGRSTIGMVFSLRQFKEKCKEQQMPLYIALVGLTKAFDPVSRDGLFQILLKISCPPKLQSVIESFHKNMKGTVQFIGSSSRPFDIRSGVKQRSLESSLLCSWDTPLAQHQRKSICGPDQMAGFSILAASEPRQRFVKPSSETCCSRTMLQWRPTPSRSCRHWWTVSLRPARFSD